MTARELLMATDHQGVAAWCWYLALGFALTYWVLS